MRARDRLRPRRHDPGAARHAAGPTSAPISAPTASPPRATPRRCCPGRIACRTSISTMALLLTNKTPAGTYRGPGRFEADFFRERLFDMAANDLGIDRVEFRRRNLVAEARDAVAAADRAAARSGQRDRQRRLPHDARPLPRRISAGTEKSKLQGQLIDGRHHGIAVGCYLEGGGSGPARERRAWCWKATARCRSMSARRRSGRASRPCSRRSPPTRSTCRWTRINRVQHGSTIYVKQGYGSYSRAPS